MYILFFLISSVLSINDLDSNSFRKRELAEKFLSSNPIYSVFVASESSNSVEKQIRIKRIFESNRELLWACQWVWSVVHGNQDDTSFENANWIKNRPIEWHQGFAKMCREAKLIKDGEVMKSEVYRSEYDQDDSFFYGCVFIIRHRIRRINPKDWEY